VLGYALDNCGFESQQGLGIFLFTTMSRLALGPTHPPTESIPRVLSLGVKPLGHKADHSLPFSAEVNVWTISLLPQYTFMVWCSVKKKHRDNFTSTFTLI
jgi:hypothetical protein